MIRHKKGMIVIVDGWENLNSGVREYENPTHAASGFVIRVVNDEESKLPIVAEGSTYPQIYITAQELEEFVLSKRNTRMGLMIGKATTNKPTST